MCWLRSGEGPGAAVYTVYSKRSLGLVGKPPPPQLGLLRSLRASYGVWSIRVYFRRIGSLIDLALAFWSYRPLEPRQGEPTQTNKAVEAQIVPDSP